MINEDYEKQESSMLIALDYDGTYTLDPEFWDLFIQSAKMRKHEVVIVSARYSSEVIERPPDNVIIYYTGRRAKKEFMENMISPDVWIDDHPEYILFNVNGEKGGGVLNFRDEDYD